MATLQTTSVRAERIAWLVSELPDNQQEELERQINKLLMMIEAEKLAKSTKKNKLTMKEIVDEVRKVRHEEN